MAQWQKYWNEEMETMPRDKLAKLQGDKLREMVAWAYDHTVFYKRKLAKAGIKPQDIKSLKDIGKLPLTTYDEFIRTPMTEKLAVPLDKVKIVSSTSGSVSGFTQPVLMTEQGWADYVELEARARWVLGIRPDDVVQVLSGFTCCERGYERLGAVTLLGHSGRRNLDQQIKLTKAMGVTVIEHLPSLVLRYFERAKEMGIDVKQTKVRMVSGVGEGWALAYRKRVEQEYGLPFRTFYGSVEAVGAAECGYGGLHMMGDMCLYEVVDIETQKILGSGEEGELVATPFHNAATPFIRYRTGDVGSFLPDQPCPCGRTHPKLALVKGRVSQIIRVSGKKLLPIDVEEVVASTPELGDEYQIIVDKPGELSRLKVKAEIRRGLKEPSGLKSRVEIAFHQGLGVESEVELVPPGTLERAIFKAQRVKKTFSQ